MHMRTAMLISTMECADTQAGVFACGMPMRHFKLLLADQTFVLRMFYKHLHLHPATSNRPTNQSAQNNNLKATQSERERERYASLFAHTSSQILLLAKNVWVSFSFWLGESFIENAVRPKNHRERKRNVQECASECSNPQMGKYSNGEYECFKAGKSKMNYTIGLKRA